MTMDIREQIARGIARKRSPTPFTDEQWARHVASYRDLCADWPDYAKGSAFVNDAFRDADAALSALEEAGYVVAPREPDEAMREAAMRYCDEKVGGKALLGAMRNAFVEIALDGYRAMVGARS